APRGVVDTACELVWVGRSMDTDMHDFADVLPGIEGIRCQERDCLADVAKGGCFYYIRGLNCFYSPMGTKPNCVRIGKSSVGGYMDCIDPQCARIESSLELDLVEQRTVDVLTVYNDRGRPHSSFPMEADIGLYRVLGLKR